MREGDGAAEARNEFRVLNQLTYAQCVNEADGVNDKKVRCDLAWMGLLGLGK